MFAAVNGSGGDPSVKTLSQVDDRVDIIYQKDTSFSAALDPRTDVNDSKLEAVGPLVVTTVSDDEQKTLARRESTDLSTTESSRSAESTCVRSCGNGTCVLEVPDPDNADDTSQRCQCVLGKAGSNCQAGK